MRPASMTRAPAGGAAPGTLSADPQRCLRLVRDAERQEQPELPGVTPRRPLWRCGQTGGTGPHAPPPARTPDPGDAGEPSRREIRRRRGLARPPQVLRVRADDEPCREPRPQRQRGGAMGEPPRPNVPRRRRCREPINRKTTIAPTSRAAGSPPAPAWMLAATPSSTRSAEFALTIRDERSPPGPMHRPVCRDDENPEPVGSLVAWGETETAPTANGGPIRANPNPHPPSAELFPRCLSPGASCYLINTPANTRCHPPRREPTPPASATPYHSDSATV